MLKEIERGRNRGFAVQVIGSDSSLYSPYRKYKRLFNLEFQFNVIGTEKLEAMFGEIELPFLAVLDDKNKVITVWKAEVEKIHLSHILLKKHIQF